MPRFTTYRAAVFAALLMFGCSGLLDDDLPGAPDAGGIRTVDAGVPDGEVPDSAVPMPFCGDGTVDEGETCDPVSSCSTECEDGNACTVDTLMGSAETCTAACAVIVIEACVNDDGCCPAACNSSDDNDCSPSCGNGVIDPMETCDPPGTCPTECNDNNACTSDTLTGSPANCSAACSNAPITACVSGDGCCAPGCNANIDTDCAPACNNGVVESGETCDPIASCPTNCNDNNACTTDTLSGTANTCGSSCSHAPIIACVSNDGCCPMGCTPANDNDCMDAPGVCGDGTCSAAEGELCTSCAADCDTTDNACGNGACQAGENSSNCFADCGPSPWPSAWAQFEDEALAEMNRHRALGTDCPQSANSPKPAFTMDNALRAAAQLHSWDQSYSGYFSHTSCNGRSPWTRAADQGTSANGETIGGGQSSAVAIINSWLNSQGHCEIMMSDRTHVGIGYAAENARYWTAIYR